jgi:sugar transferase EpsL
MKRIFDIILSCIIIIIMSPICIIVVLAILIFQGMPIFFKQDRLGMNHAPFKIIKFCTMTREKDQNNNLLSDKNRTTRLGNFLRKSSIDEFPSLWNVLKGEMSVVGPRPLRARYLERYSEAQDRRHEVKPGITGWAQINGRNAITWDERFKLDVWYVDHQSFLLDYKILLLTIFVVLLRKDINSSSDDTMQEFLGNDNNS